MTELRICAATIVLAFLRSCCSSVSLAVAQWQSITGTTAGVQQLELVFLSVCAAAAAATNAQYFDIIEITKEQIEMRMLLQQMACKQRVFQMERWIIWIVTSN